MSSGPLVSPIESSTFDSGNSGSRMIRNEYVRIRNDVQRDDHQRQEQVLARGWRVAGEPVGERPADEDGQARADGGEAQRPHEHVEVERVDRVLEVLQAEPVVHVAEALRRGDREQDEEAQRDEEERRVVGHRGGEQGERITPLGHAEQAGPHEQRAGQHEHRQRADEQRDRGHEPRRDRPELGEQAGGGGDAQQAESARGRAAADRRLRGARVRAAAAAVTP